MCCFNLVHYIPTEFGLGDMFCHVTHDYISLCLQNIKQHELLKLGQGEKDCSPGIILRDRNIGPDRENLRTLVPHH
jgi:hypothetical protein